MAHAIAMLSMPMLKGALPFDEKSIGKNENKNNFKLHTKTEITKNSWSNIPSKLTYYDRATGVANFCLNNTRHHLLGDYLGRFNK
jgi:hypothetical protein